MALTADKVVVELQAKVDAYNANVLRAESTFTRAVNSMTRGASSLAINVAKGFVAFQAANIVVDASRALVEYAQASIRVNNALKIAGLAGQELVDVYDSLYASAQKNAVPIESLTQLYGRLALVQGELKITGEELLSFTDNIGIALRVSGKSAQEASGALLQLSQALGSGVVRAEEFNSILEGALPIAQAAAAGLEEAGGSVAKLRKLIIDGKVSSEAFFRAFEAGASTLQDKLSGSVLTVDQALVQLNNRLIDAAGKIDNAVGVSQRLSGALDTLGGWVDSVGQFFEDNAAPIQNFINLLGQALAIAGQLTNIMPRNFAAEIEAARGRGLRDMLAPVSNGSNAPPELQEALNRVAAGRRAGGSTVSLKDFPVDPTGNSKKKTPQQKFDDSLKRIRDMTAATELETAALGHGTEVKTKSLTIERLLNEARDAGLKITPEVRAAIDETATAYAQATAEAERLAEAQQNGLAVMAEFRSLAADVLGGFIDDLREGKSAAEALGNVFDKLADKLIDIAVQNLVMAAFGGIFGGTGGSALTGVGKVLFGGFASGTPNTGGQRGKPAGIVHGQEAVIPLPSGGKVPVELAGGNAASDYISVQATMEVVNGNLVPVITEVSGQVAGRAVRSYDNQLQNRTAEKNARYQ